VRYHYTKIIRHSLPVVLAAILAMGTFASACSKNGSDMTDETITKASSTKIHAAEESGTQVAAGAFYVSTTGSDKNKGTYESPWATLSYAVDQLRPGDTLYLRGGIYSQKLLMTSSGTDEKPITISSYPEETAVLDGTGLPMSSSMDAMLHVVDQNYVRIERLEICNYTTSKTGTCVAGILVEGACAGIELRNNNVHHIANIAAVDGDLNGRDAHGIAVYGSSNVTIADLKIIGNEVSNCTLGSSEALTVNGNVAGFTVSGNRVYNHDNIGIVFIGYEGTCPTTSLDRARDGVCSGNTVYNIESSGNPAYGPDQSADGIYCDGATRITIKDNVVHNANYGIELASEHGGRDTSYNTVSNNLVYFCTNAGLAMGGYDTDRGSSFGNTITHNTFYKNDTSNGGFGEINLQYFATDNTIANNIFYASVQNIFVSDVDTTNTGNTMNSNVYYSEAEDESGIWIWQNIEIVGLEAFRTTGNDTKSVFADPLFANPSADDFSVMAKSPAITLDAGKR